MMVGNRIKVASSITDREILHFVQDDYRAPKDDHTAVLAR